ncbi:hypothetical protein BDZ85DRAFT_274930 [Elsinoe ampelina]|uniref:LysM domain-containing protein n=1 Tax=Elsinoe ampelina TaxID=302913 RepID=A0A6A6G8W4_9PEZI|nr:hypothetical protein BDZ85DRAFT_274930 [Elsinoe ampelina]
MYLLIRDERNTTVACDQDLFQWTVKVDEVWWEPSDASTLCTSSCTASAQSWQETVDSDCVDQELRMGGRYVPAQTISARFLDGLNIACLQSSDRWCLIDSYEWTGSDVVQADCTANPSLPQCIIPGNVSSSDRRMANLYSDDLLCSDCFVKLLHARVMSDFLPDTDYSDYLVAQLQDIEDVCQTTLGDIRTRALPVYPTATLGDGVITPTTNVATATPTACSSREVDVLVANSWIPFEACNELARQYQVATGELLKVTGSLECYSETPVCVPLQCNLLKVESGATCESIARRISNVNTTVNAAQLAVWNPNIMGACDFLREGQEICISGVLASRRQRSVRGGPGSTASLPIIENPSTPPKLIQEGIAPGCNRYVMANSTVASCWKIANDASILTTRLYELNPVLGERGENCDTQIWLSYFYCVGVSGGDTMPTQTTRTVTATTSGSATSGPSSPRPTQTQSGIATDCNKWTEAESGDYCGKLASDARIEPSLFYKWNSVLGSNGENCDTQIWPGYFYCVGVSSPPADPTITSLPSSTAALPKPTQTQSNIPANCNKFIQAQAGDYCWKLATDNGLETSRFYALNPVLGANGENCDTQIWPGYWYCAGTSG